MTDDKSGFVEDDMESVASAVSKITFGEESVMTKKSASSFRTTNTGYKSILYKHQQSERRDRHDSNQVKKKNVYGSKDFRVPYIVDVWSSRKSRMSCSMQVQCLTGLDAKKTHFFRVSTDRHWLTLRVEMSESALDAQKAFYKVLEKLSEREREMLLYHVKISARNTSVSKLTGRDAQKRVILEQRMRLPFACEHAFATKENDPFFYGIQFIDYPETGETWAHVELVQHIKDGYVGRDIAHTAYMDSIVEEEADEMSNAGNSVMMENVMDERDENNNNGSPSMYTTTSHVSNVSHLKDPSDYETPTKSVDTTPKTTPKVPVAKYPPMVSDVKEVSSTMSLCTHKGHRAIVSQVPMETGAVVLSKSSNHTYDGRITRASVKRAAYHQE